MLAGKLENNRTLSSFSSSNEAKAPCAGRYEKHHQLRYDPEAIKAAVRLATQHLGQRKGRCRFFLEICVFQIKGLGFGGEIPISFESVPTGTNSILIADFHGDSTMLRYINDRFLPDKAIDVMDEAWHLSIKAAT